MSIYTFFRNFQEFLLRMSIYTGIYAHSWYDSPIFSQDLAVTRLDILNIWRFLVRVKAKILKTRYQRTSSDISQDPRPCVKPWFGWAQSDTLIRSLRVGTFLLLLQNIWFEKESRNRPMPCLNFINARSTFWTRQTKYSNYQYLPVLRTDNRFSCTTDSFAQNTPVAGCCIFSKSNILNL